MAYIRNSQAGHTAHSAVVSHCPLQSACIFTGLPQPASNVTTPTGLLAESLPSFGLETNRKIKFYLTCTWTGAFIVIIHFLWSYSVWKAHPGGWEGVGAPFIRFFSDNRTKLGRQYFSQIDVICLLQPLPTPSPFHSIACSPWKGEGRCYVGQIYFGWREK